jgi:hypothetical protein
MLPHSTVQIDPDERVPILAQNTQAQTAGGKFALGTTTPSARWGAKTKSYPAAGADFVCAIRFPTPVSFIAKCSTTRHGGFRLRRCLNRGTRALFDLAWPTGVQEELSQLEALLMNEPAATLAIANQAAFQCFTEIMEFQRYVRNEVLGDVAPV